MKVESRSVLRSILRRWWPELVVGVLAGFIFLGFLGSLELWGKREQRAAAETLDTVENGHWLVAQIQGRPRLEKPPLPRWTTALLMTITERTATSGPCVCRAPVSGLATAFLVYLLGATIGGRGLALAASMAICTMWLFITELRQAGNDGPLGLFTTHGAVCGMVPATRKTACLSASGQESRRRDSWTTELGPSVLCRSGIGVPVQGTHHFVARGTDAGSLSGDYSGGDRTGLKQLADGAGLLIFQAWP